MVPFSASVSTVKRQTRPMSRVEYPKMHTAGLASLVATRERAPSR